MPTGPGCQVDAGILAEGGQLTDAARNAFIGAVKDELTFGTVANPRPPIVKVGPAVPPNEFAAGLTLEDRAAFPGFHDNVVGAFERTARALNMPSDFKLLPVCCPAAVAAKLGIELEPIEFPGGFLPFMVPNLPLLASKLKIMPPTELAAKLPGLVSVPPPIPSFDVPSVSPAFIDLAGFTASYIAAVPKTVAILVGQAPKLASSLANPRQMLQVVADAVVAAEPFGRPGPGSSVLLVAAKVLAAKVAEMVLVAVVGTTLGSSRAGITGGLGGYFGYFSNGAQGRVAGAGG